ncbi:ATP-grasp domain-containing protein [Humibacter albus]|uniref:ATP-grasp domain-containing protein n=1 Tax=Humibacter albus TaxID=427754 RepID=UPI00146A67A4|nr:ATP-grasp domain-containing protein [Humibacter albus]
MSVTDGQSSGRETARPPATSAVGEAVEDRALPLLALVYGSLSLEQPLQRLAEASQGVCRLLWVLPFDRKDSRSALRLLRAEGEIRGDVVNASALSPAEAADAVHEYHPDGIACFIDETIAWTADVAQRLGLPFHSPEAADRLTDKLQQRLALTQHGLRTPAFWDADALTDDDALADVGRSAGYPVVLKPRRGTSSQDTEAIASESDLRAAVAARVPGRMLVESFIPDPTVPCTGRGSAPYVSVEVLVSAGTASVLGVTGRTPLAEPFRETGQYFPADTTAEAAEAFAEAATAAAEALGITTGVLHVEVKCTDLGPVVIEVNGRPGGGSTGDFMKRAHGIDLITLAMRVALGERIAYESLPLPSEVLFRLDIQPDARLRRITAIDGLDEVLRIPGVEQVTPDLSVGDAFSWRKGTFSRVAVVTGAAPDHDSAQRIRTEVLSTIKIEGTE